MLPLNPVYSLLPGHEKHFRSYSTLECSGPIEERPLRHGTRVNRIASCLLVVVFLLQYHHSRQIKALISGGFVPRQGPSRLPGQNGNQGESHKGTPRLPIVPSASQPIMSSQRECESLCPHSCNLDRQWLKDDPASHNQLYYVLCTALASEVAKGPWLITLSTPRFLVEHIVFHIFARYRRKWLIA